MEEVAGRLVFIASGGVEVIHQDEPLGSLEHARSFDMSACAGVCIQVNEVFLPRTFQARRGCLLYAVLNLLAAVVLRVSFIEEVIEAVLVDDVVVDAAVLRLKEHLGFALETCEIAVGIGVVGDEGLAVAALQGEVNHVLARRAVVDGLWCPHPVGIAEVLGIILRQHYLRVRPVHQVLGFQHHYARIGTPTLLRVVGVHVCGHDVIVVVLSAQDMWIPYAAAGADAVAGNDGLIPVQCKPVLSVLAHRKS